MRAAPAALVTLRGRCAARDHPAPDRCAPTMGPMAGTGYGRELDASFGPRRNELFRRARKSTFTLYHGEVK